MSIDGLGQLGVNARAEDGAGARVGVHQGNVLGRQGEPAYRLLELGRIGAEEAERRLPRAASSRHGQEAEAHAAIHGGEESLTVFEGVQASQSAALREVAKEPFGRVVRGNARWADQPRTPLAIEQRALLRAELDAYYARLYGLTRKQLRYILDPHDLTDRELTDILDPTEDPPDAPRTKDFPGETFRVLKERDIKEHGEYRTKRLVLEAWHHLQEAPTTPIAEAEANISTLGA